MRKLILFLLSVIIIFSTYRTSGTQKSLIHGLPASSSTFPEAIYIQNEKGDRCSASVIGKKVLLTAAHCVETSRVIRPVNKKKHEFVAVCDTHIKWEGDDYDIALCHSDNDLAIDPASLMDRGPRSGELVLLSGFGCTSSRRFGGNDGILRIGFSRIDSLAGVDNTFHTRAETTLCSGDSGGAAYMHGNMETDMHYIYGVNSQTDFVSLSIMQAVYTEEAKKFFNVWSKRRKAKICGLNVICESPRRPANPGPDNDE